MILPILVALASEHFDILNYITYAIVFLWIVMLEDIFSAILSYFDLW